MRELFVEKVIDTTEDFLDNNQRIKLKEILTEICLNYQIESIEQTEKQKILKNNTDILNKFISSKEIEGCSTRTLNYYKDNIIKMLDTINLPIDEITTEILRNYLADYKSNSKAGMVTIDNIRRTLSSFFTWLERKYENIKVVQYKKQSEFEKSLVVLPNADIIQTQNGKDNYLGNALEQEVIDFERISGKNKIRTIIAHNNEEIRNTIVDSIKKLGFADVVATATNGIETYNKIIDLKPEMVFAKFEMEDMNGFEIVKKSKEKLDSDIPVFNIFAEEMPKNEIEKIYNIAGRKFNAIISEEQYQFEVPFILEQYKKYKEYKESKEQ